MKILVANEGVRGNVPGGKTHFLRDVYSMIVTSVNKVDLRGRDGSVRIAPSHDAGHVSGDQNVQVLPRCVGCVICLTTT